MSWRPPLNFGGKKVEGMSPPWLQARICWWKVEFWWFGLKPGLETQRFLPRGRSDRALDRTVSGVCRQGCFATEGAWAVVPPGRPFGSRWSGALSFPSPAGAAHGSGNFETLSTLSPPFRNHQKEHIPIIGISQGA
jgi:hypothetical protein